MSIIESLQRLWRREATRYVFASIPSTRQDSNIDDVTITAEQQYFRVWASEMFLKDDGRLFLDFVPVVHSSVRLQLGARLALWRGSTTFFCASRQPLSGMITSPSRVSTNCCRIRSRKATGTGRPVTQ